MVMKRLQKEYELIKAEPFDTFSAEPINKADMYHWIGFVIGPEGTPYEGGKFRLDIKFYADYPFKPPSVTFITKVYHPNITSHGKFCFNGKDILKEGWSPRLTISHVLIAIIELLKFPSADDPLVPEIAAIYKANKNQFDRTASEWCKEYAS